MAGETTTRAGQAPTQGPAQQVPSAASGPEAAGVAVDFTTPLLAGARVRMSDAGRHEVLVADLGGGGGQYVVPLDHLGRALTLTVHDRVLCAEIMQRNVQSPEDVRRVVLAVAEMGLAGRKAAAAARKAIEDDQSERLVASVYLIHRAIAQGGNDPAGLPLAALASEANRAQVKLQLSAVAHAARISTDAVHATLEEWAGVIGPVGVPGMPIECRMRRQARQVVDLANELRHWAEDDVSPLAGNARAVAQHAERAGGEAARQIAALDRFADAMLETVSGWKKSLVELRRIVRELAWTLNGWVAHVRRWREAAQISRGDQQAAVAAMFATVCEKPKPQPADRWRVDDLRGLQRGAQGMHKDWKTGPVDFNAARRLEAIKQYPL